MIYINSADYTAWAYRWQCLEALGRLDDEMQFINEMASRSPKNYQLWNHRRRLAFKRGPDYAQEVLFAYITHSSCVSHKSTLASCVTMSDDDMVKAHSQVWVLLNSISQSTQLMCRIIITASMPCDGLFTWSFLLYSMQEIILLGPPCVACQRNTDTECT